MLSNSWSLKLTHPPFGQLVRLIDVGSDSLSFIYQSIGKKMLIHNKNTSKQFPVQRDVTAFQVFRVQDKELVALLGDNLLSCFDVLNNNELFNLEMESASTVHFNGQHLFVASGANLHCLDLAGTQIFNCYLSGNVVCLCSQPPYLFLGLDDRSIKIYSKDSLMLDYSNLANQPCCIAYIQKTSVVVGFTDGMVAVYETKKAKWKAKSKHVPKDIIMCHIDDISHRVMVVGRQDGQIQLRSWIDGGFLSKLNIQQKICKVLLGDYRKDQNEQLIVISQSGVIRGYNMSSKVDAPKILIEKQKQDLAELISALKNRKTDLQIQIEQLKAIPESQTNEILKSNFEVNHDMVYKDKVSLKITCKNCFIKGITFEEPLAPMILPKPAQKLIYNIEADCNQVGTIHGQVLISSYPATTFQTRNLTFNLKKFWKWVIMTQRLPEVESLVTVKYPERMARFVKWLDQSFNLSMNNEQLTKLQDSSKVELVFQNIFDKSPLQIRIQSNPSQIIMRCEDLQALSLAIQDLSDYMNIKDLEVEGHFPKQMAMLRQKLNQIEEINKNKTSISSEIADSINNIKALVVKAQDSRVLNRMNDIRRTYASIMDQNHKLYVQMRKKTLNTNNLTELLKYVGLTINIAANMRIGKARTRVNTLCRQALKNKQFVTLINVIQKGSD